VPRQQSQATARLPGSRYDLIAARNRLRRFRVIDHLCRYPVATIKITILRTASINHLTLNRNVGSHQVRQQSRRQGSNWDDYPQADSGAGKWKSGRDAYQKDGIGEARATLFDVGGRADFCRR